MMYWRATVVTTACLLYAIAVSDMQVAAQHLDVCATCHPNATCKDKPSGGGKICNCMYGFVGNGRTSCIDKDECQVGASTICGLHTSCHNTYGSFYCTCLVGYSPSNNLAFFIPNDGTRCQDIDECRVQGICGEGGQCRNLQGDYNCHCQLGYQVQNGTEPFHPDREKTFCKAIDCGKPPSVENAVQLSATVTRYGSIIKFGCEEGFLWRNGDNSSVCGANSEWKGPGLVCEEVDCGAPPALPHSDMLWDKRSTVGSELVYQCSSGYYNVGHGNVSVCTANGKWNTTSLLCQEISCGDPPLLPHTGQVWNGRNTVGSSVLYYCKKGFHIQGGGNISHCTENGYWTKPALSCKEITCGDPPLLPHTGQVWNGNGSLGGIVFYYCKDGFYREDLEGGNVSLCTENGYWSNSALSCKEVDCGAPPTLPHSVMLWDKSSAVGSEVVYECSAGYFNVGQGNVSVCTANGQWSKAALLCQEISCGDPPLLPHTGLVWNGRTTVGSSVLYYCKKGFYIEVGGNLSHCTENGYWTKPALSCKAKCVSAPTLVNTEVVWHNTSAVIHGCLKGYYSWRGSNISVCDNTGKWKAATLLCREIKPAISKLVVFNETCLSWKAEKYEDDTEDYKIVFIGCRNYQKTFHDKRKKLLRSAADQLQICLNLLPVTNYTITVTALSAKFTSTLTVNTSLQVPQAPETLYREVETLLPTLTLRRSANTLDPISFYQVFVLQLEGILVFDCDSPKNPDFSSQGKFHGQYITAQVYLKNVGREMNFTVGDGHYYGGYYNAPLQPGREYYIILRAVSHWRGAFKHTCVIWAKVRGMPYVMKMSLFFVGGSVGLFAMAILLGYCYIRFCKKT